MSYKNFLVYVIENHVDDVGHLNIDDVDNVVNTYHDIERKAAKERHENILKEIEEYFDDPENVKKAKEFFSGEDSQSLRVKAWVDKFAVSIKNMSDEELDNFMTKLFKWEEKYEQMEYDRGIATISNVFNVIENVFSELGEEVDDLEETFLASSYEYRGYRFNTYCGQGCFTRVYKDGETVFQTT